MRSILTDIVTKIEDRALVRAEVTDVRVKSLQSLELKATSKGWGPQEALSQCGDLVGGRVVCNNTEDVYRFAELLKDHVSDAQGFFEVQDYVKKPNAGGYRGLHVNFALDVDTQGFQSDLVACEVQIRSRLQDAWARLAHDDIYKQPTLPADLRARAKDLSEVLAAADTIASDIRLRVMHESVPPEARPNMERVSQDALAFIFKNVFGRSPRDYAIRQALNLCSDLGVVSLETLPEIMGSEDFRNRVAAAYQSIMPLPFSADDTLLAGICAVAKGESKAIAWVKRAARKEWREIEKIAHREMLSSLPSTIDELLRDLEDVSADSDIEGWAEALGATTKCSICGARIVHPFSFAEAAVQHYQIYGENTDRVHGRVESAVYGSGVDTGGWESGSLCSYHADQAAKND